MLKKRIIAYVIDSLIITTPCILLGLIHVMYYEMIHELKIYRILTRLILLSLCFCYVGPVCKDIIRKRSFGKKIMKLKIVSFDGSEPDYGQLLIRNISMYIWPIEAMLLLLDKQRLGDKRAKTKVVEE